MTCDSGFGQGLVTQVPTPEPRLLATFELPLAGRSFSTDSRGAALELPLAGRSFSTDSRGTALQLPLAGRSFSTDSRGAALELPLAGRSFSTDSRGTALQLPLAGRSFSIDSLFILQRCQASPCLNPHIFRFSLRQSWVTTCSC
jgi:hypothetical protein